MADYYADSSVLVKRHVDEVGSGWFRALADPATGNVTGEGDFRAQKPRPLS